MSLKCNQLDLIKILYTNKNHNIIRYACRADKWRYRHDCRAYKRCCRHDRLADKRRYRQDRGADIQCPNVYSTYSSVTDMLSNLGLGSLENRRSDARLTMFYKIVYGLVAIPLLSYFVHCEVYTRHMHSLYYRHIQASVCYYQH